MRPAQAGPEHLLEAERIWKIGQVAAVVDLGGREHRLSAGDPAIVPAHQVRRIRADDPAGFMALDVAQPARVLMADGTDRGIPDWIA